MWIFEGMGTLGEWAAAGGTVWAVFVALRASRGERKAEELRRAEKELDDKERAKRERRQHADLVSVWSEAPWESGEESVRVCIFNAGTHPITSIGVSYPHIDQEGEESDAATLKPPLQPKKTVFVVKDSFAEHIGGEWAVVHFTDVNGVKWSRDTDGVLLELEAGSSSPVA